MSNEYPEPKTEIEKEVYNDLGISKQDRSKNSASYVQSNHTPKNLHSYSFSKEKYLNEHQTRKMNNQLYSNIFDPYKPYAKHAL